MSRSTKSLLWWIGGLAVIVAPYLTLWQTEWHAGLPDPLGVVLRWATTVVLLALVGSLNPWRAGKQRARRPPATEPTE